MIPDNVQFIDASAFNSIETLTGVGLPDAVIAIGDRAFYRCKNLKWIVLSGNLKIIGQDAFCGCKSLASITIPESIEKIEKNDFSECENLREISLAGDANKIKTKVFGETLPKPLMNRIEEVEGVLSDGLLKEYVLTKEHWREFDPKIKAELYWKRHSKSLQIVYEKLVTVADVKAMLPEIQEKLKMENTAVAANAATAFLTQFQKKLSVKQAQTLYNMIGAAKNNTVASGKLKNDTALAEKLDGTEKKRKQEEKKVAEKLAEQKAEAIKHSEYGVAAEAMIEKLQLSEKELKTKIKQNYGLTSFSFPELRYRDSVTAPPAVLMYLLSAHGEVKEFPYFYNALEYDYVLKDDYEKPGVCLDATAFLDLLDNRSVQEAILKLSDTFFATAGAKAKKLFLMFPVCRYATEETMRQIILSYQKWCKQAKSVFNDAVLYSNTKSAILLSDKLNNLQRYANMRGTDEDTVRDHFLSDVGLDENGCKTYDLGNQTVTARLQTDLSIMVEVADGKIVKSLPKKEADQDKYATAVKDLTALKKQVKEVFRNRCKTLFADFLSGKEVEASEWLDVYHRNPVLRIAASLVIWQQASSTFRLKDTEFETADGSSYTIGSTPIKVAHPMEMDEADVIAWQKYFTSRGLKQPFIQIWEPVYQRDTIKEARYVGFEIPYYRLKDRSKHGIHVEYNYSVGGLEATFNECDVELLEVMPEKHFISMDAPLKITSFKYRQYSRQVNHIVAYLDQITVIGRILRDDVTIADNLDQFTLAQITEFLKLATENNCTNVLALLMEYKNANYADFDPMAEFTLE